MSFFSQLVAPYRKGEKNFERGRKAELRRDYTAKEYFEKSAAAFDDHFTRCRKRGREPGTTHLVMAGISYTRINRFEDALDVLRQAISRSEIPDAYLHAGYAALQLGHSDEAVSYLERYPSWADQRIIATAIKEIIPTLTVDAPDTKTACSAIQQAIFRQDKANAKNKNFVPYKPVYPANRGY